MRYFKKLLPAIIFCIAVVLFYDYADMHRTMKLRPCSVHMWAQCERASIALNYYENDMNFFFPRIHKFTHGSGITGLEFPLVNYIPAICYRLFGFNEVFYRAFVFLSLVFGLYMFYRLINRFTDNNLVSLGLTCAGALSPVLVYYSNNFMPDVTSLGFSLVAWYYFFRFKEDLKQKHLVLFLVFAVLAALIKITSLIVLLVVLNVILLGAFGFFKKEPNGSVFNKKEKKKLLIGIVIGIGVIAGWYMYAMWLTKHFKTDAFALSHTIISELDAFYRIWKRIVEVHKYEYYPYEAYVLIMSVLVVLLIGYRYVNRLLFTITLLTLLGNIGFIYFMFSQFEHHDYYIIPLLTGVFLLMLTFGDFLKRISFKYSKIVMYIFVIVLFFNLKESVIACRTEFERRYDPKFVRWITDFESYWDLEAKLRKLGVKRTDYALCGFEPSFCNGLYLMDQLGNTLGTEISSQELKANIENPRYKYLVVNDSAKLNGLYKGDLTRQVFTTHRGLVIYKLR